MVKLDFDPNRMHDKAWSTFIPSRHPQFKLHARRAHALSAFQSRSAGILFRHDGEKWIEVCRYGDGILMQGCAVKGCQAKLMPEEMFWRWGEEYKRLEEEGFERAQRVWIDRDTDSPSFAVVCSEHKRAIGRKVLRSPLPIVLKGAS